MRIETRPPLVKDFAAFRDNAGALRLAASLLPAAQQKRKTEAGGYKVKSFQC
jgi:hypothetical protein